MLKNTLKIISIFMIIVLFFALPIVRADNETTENNEINLINETHDETEHQEEGTPSLQNTLKPNDVFLSGKDIVVDYIVDGNLFIFADNVTIDSQVGGDAFIFARNVTISEKAYIYSNLFTTAQNVTIKGIVYDVYSLANTVTIDGYVYRDLKSISTSLNINGVIGRNGYVTASNIHFAENNSDTEESAMAPKGLIGGNLTYSSTSETNIPEGAVSGTTDFQKINQKDSDFNLQDYIISFGIFVITITVIWLVCLWITPKFLEKAQTTVKENKLAIILYGLLTPIVSILLIAILIILGLTSHIAILFALLISFLVLVSSSIFVITLNNIICNKVKVEKDTIKFGFLLITSTIIWFISLIPYVGIVVSCLTYVIGLGIIMKNIIPIKFKKKAKKEDTKLITENNENIENIENIEKVENIEKQEEN